MRDLRRKLSDSFGIAWTAIGIFLLVTFYGACILGAFSALVLAVVYAGAMIRIEARTSRCRRPLTAVCNKVSDLVRSVASRKVAATENRQ